MLNKTLNQMTDAAQRELLWDSRYQMEENPESTIPGWYGEHLFYSGREAITTYLDATAQGHDMKLRIVSETLDHQLDSQSVALLTIMYIENYAQEARRMALEQAVLAVGKLK
jgi:hypothetical protein